MVDYSIPRFIFEAVLNAAGINHNEYPSRRDHSPITIKRSLSPEIRKGEVEILPYERFNGDDYSEIDGDDYSEIADKNARELIKQEEQIKLKAEKKKAKKKKQKQKKKELSKDNIVNKNIPENDYSNNKILKNTEDLVLNTDKKEAESLDVDAAFVTKAIKTVKNITVIPEESKNKNNNKCVNSLLTTAIDFENKQHFKEAVQNLSEAISLRPKRFDILLRRSFIYYQLAKFEKSIRDAERVLLLSPNNVEGYYRLAEGHFAMNNLSKAEEAFTKLLSFNAYINEANKRLFSIRVKQLEEMGYNPNEAFTALTKSKNKLDEAIEYLTDLEKGIQDKEDLYYSDEEESEEEDYEEDGEENYEEDGEKNGEGANGSLKNEPSKQSLVIDKKSPLLSDPSNPLQCCSLFVGNLKKDIKHKDIHDVFIKFGTIINIKLETETACYAFVNFEKSSSAGRAMEALQGSRWLLSTIPLILRYPTNVANTIVSTMKTPELVRKLNSLQSVGSTFPIKKLSVIQSTDKATISNQSANHMSDLPKPVRPRPPPMTEDCFFWTTTGCVYGSKCFNLHRPQLKGSALNSKRTVPFKNST